LRGIIDCSRPDFSNESRSILRCGPVLVPTMLPEGSAADIRAKPFDHGVAEIHPRDHLVARFTF